MLHISFALLAVWASAGALALAGLANLVGLRSLREMYAEWDLPEIFYHSVGLLQILAAVFLISPDMRVYGIAIAGPIMFGAVVMLLNYERYALAAPVAAMMAMLFITALTVLPVRFHSTVQFSPAVTTQGPAAANIRTASDFEH
jgi:hypothetical protein